MNLIILTIGCLLILFSSAQMYPQASWDQLLESSKKNNMTMYGRSSTTYALYQTYRKQLTLKNTTLPQNIKTNLLGLNGKSQNPIYPLGKVNMGGKIINVYATNKNPESIRWTSSIIQPKKAITSISSKQNYALFAPNSYPYNIEPGIEHWVMWSNIIMEVEQAKDIVNLFTAPDYQNITYENVIQRRSIPELYHVQIYFRKKPEERPESSQPKQHLNRHHITKS